MNRAITRILSKPRSRVILVGKASTISGQLKQLAAMELGRIPQGQGQDIDSAAENYNPRVSYEVLK